MTPARQPHPHRCETCSHHILQTLMKEPHICDHPMFQDEDEAGLMFIGIDEFIRIGVLGCASHSTHTSAPAPASKTMAIACQICKDAAAKAERERFAEELRSMYVQAFDDPYVNNVEKDAYRRVDGWIKSLRQQEPQQEGPR